MRYSIGYLLILRSIIDIAVASVTGINEENQLIQHLKTVLPRFSPPANIENSAVYIHADIMQILFVNEKDGVWSVKLWLSFFYLTPSCRWDPQQFGGIDRIVVPGNTFWTPDLGTVHWTYVHWSLREVEQILETSIWCFFPRYQCSYAAYIAIFGFYYLSIYIKPL